jgi:hypothetical protein
VESFKVAATAKENQRMELLNEGQVKFIAIPQGFVECPEPARDVDVRFLRRFQSADNDKVELAFFYRGAPMNKVIGADFRGILSAPPHELSAEEVESIQLVLRDASEPDWFDLSSARTDLLQGKTVLLIEGTWKNSHLYNLGIFIDVDGSGCIVQEIHYTAPLDVREKYAEIAKAAISSIEWK